MVESGLIPAVYRVVRWRLIPSRSPELNPVENLWQFLRDNWQGSSLRVQGQPCKPKLPPRFRPRGAGAT